MKDIRNKIVNLRLMHYIFAGGITFCVEFIIFVLGYYVFLLTPTASNSLSYVIALTTSFILNKHWVFSKTVQTKQWQKQTLLYLMLAVFNLTITNIALNHLIELKVPAFIIKLTFIIVIAGWNFIIFRKVIFNTNNSIN